MPLPETLAALSLFGVVFVCPLIFLLTKHQRAMAEILNRQGSSDTQRRIEQLEAQVQELKALQYHQILSLDEQAELIRRTSK